jgi:hypothetical protein
VPPDPVRKQDFVPIRSGIPIKSDRRLQGS